MNSESSDFLRDQRRALVEGELRELGITDEAVLRAMASVPREAFVPDALTGQAYLNVALPIDSGQTISQPYIVALMTEALGLDREDRVLEIGAGTGYAAAILAEIAKKVFTIERHRELADSARDRLRKLGYDNVEVLHGDGTKGWPEKAPFDAIVATASGPGVPSALLDQLKDGGRIVIPIGGENEPQSLIRIVRHGTNDFEREELAGVRFVPMIGEGEWTKPG